MRRNVGILDVVIRFVIGVAALAVALSGVGTTVAVVLVVITGFMFLTAALQFCPLYGMLRMSTKRERPRRPGSATSAAA